MCSSMCLLSLITVSLIPHSRSFQEPQLSTFENLNLDDILRSDLMPTTFLMIGGEAKDNKGDEEPLSSRQGDLELTETPFETSGNKGTLPDGAFNSAFSTMRFHRQKFNEYLCNTFLASQILSDVLPGNKNISSEFSRRLGMFQPTVFNRSSSANEPILNSSEYVDVGSKAYQKWLQKSTSFANFNQPPSPSANQNTPANFTPISGSGGGRRNDFYDYEEAGGGGDYFDGEVSGYAIQPNNVHVQVHQPAAAAAPPFNPYLAINHGIEDIKNSDGRRTLHKGELELPPPPLPTLPSAAYPLLPATQAILLAQQAPSPFEAQYFAPAAAAFPAFPVPLSGGGGAGERGHGQEAFYPSEHDYPVHHQPQYKSHKSHGLKEIFEIALTTLAFLSFGMFMLQVIMCITMEHQAADGSMVVSPMEGSAELDPVTEEVRKRRALPVGNAAQINDLAKIVLMSIESTHEADADNGQCLFRTLCETNRFSRTAKDTQKYWIPLWGLGMTWMSPRFLTKNNRMGAILDSLKASILGLGNANCHMIYSKCSFRDHHLAREEYRRKKRSLSGKLNLG